MMFAEHLKLRRWYFLDDDIESFYEYDNRLAYREMKKNKHSTFKALNFMSKVLEDSISNDEKINIDGEKLKNWSINVLRINKTENVDLLIKELYGILFDRKLVESKNSALEIINELLIKYNYNDILLDIKNHLLNDKSKVIGSVALWCRQSRPNYEDRLLGVIPKK